MYPSDRAQVSRQSVTAFIFLFLLFFFFLEDYIGLHTWVTQTYYGSSTGLRSVLQSERRYIASQPIGTIWSAVCELAKGGMLKVDYVGLSIDQKLNHAWNYSSINRIRQCFNFSNYRLGKTHKIFGCKMGPNFEKKVSCIV